VLTAGAIAALSFVVTQLGRYAQSHALAKAPATQVVYAGGSVATTPRTAPTSDAEPPPLTDAEADVDPDMGDPLDAGPESYLGDPDDRHGADDQPVP
jgi:hypothetical protein